MTRLAASLRRSSWLNWLLAIVSAAFLILIFPRTSLTWLAPFALTPLLIALSREPRPWMRFLLGWVTGIVFWGGVCYWIQFVLEVHGGMGRWGGWGTFILFCLFKGLHQAVFALLAAVVLPHSFAIPAVAALWAGIERTHAELGFTWLLLGNAGIDMAVPLRAAPFTGVYGVSFLFAAFGTAFALVILRRPRKHLLWLLLLLPVLALPSIPEPRDPDASAVLVQPNVPEEFEWTPVAIATAEERLIQMSARAALGTTSRLIVWPEVPGPFYYDRDPRFHEDTDQLARRTHSWFLFGTVAHTPEGAPLNSAVMLKPDGGLIDRYDKMHLVPFGEFVPKLFDWVNRITQEAGDFAPGTRRVLFPMDGHRVGAFICYESAFASEVRRFVADGADLLVNISNDGYFGHSAARAQHLDLVRMRAVENRRWILRATNDGFTAAVDPAGRVRATVAPYREEVARFYYGYVREQTAYTRSGDWFAWSCLAFGVLALLLSQRPHYTRPQQAPGK